MKLVLVPLAGEMGRISSDFVGGLGLKFRDSGLGPECLRVGSQGVVIKGGRGSLCLFCVCVCNVLSSRSSRHPQSPQQLHLGLVSH